MTLQELFTEVDITEIGHELARGLMIGNIMLLVATVGIIYHLWRSSRKRRKMDI